MTSRQEKIQSGAEKTVEKEIAALKRGLVKMANIEGFRSTFGEMEVNWLRRKYQYAVELYELDGKSIFTLIDDFENWCKSYF